MKSFAKLLTGALLLLPGCYANTVTVYFTNLPATVENGTYNGFSIATVNGIPNQLLICDDYFDTTYMPSSSNMIYYDSTLTGLNPLQYAMFATATPAANVQKYEEAAVLVYQLAQLGPQATGDQATDYNYALWNLMNPQAPLDPSRSAQEQALQAGALAQVTNPADTAFLTNSVYAYTNVYTPTAPFGGNQEFLQYNAPEPAFGLPAAAVLALTFAFRRRLRGSSPVR